MARIGLMMIAVLTLWVNALAQDGTYRLKPDDVIAIAVYNENQILQQVPVGRDGNISAPFVGTVRAEGKTTSELEAELTKLYITKLKLRDPRVSVTIVRFRTVRATITGAVNRPGTYDLRPGDTLISLLGHGQNYIFDRADRKRCMLRRSGSNEMIPVDLQALMDGDTSQNYIIDDGDEFIVAEDTRNFISVGGAVAAPNYFTYRPGMRLSDAISLARGEIPGRSKFSEIYIIREMPGQPGRYYRIKANYVRFVQKGDSSQNVELQARDVIFASFTKTPNWGELGQFANSFLVLDRFLTDGLFGFRLFR